MITVLLDMDGVLCDLERRVQEVTADLGWPDGYTQDQQVKRFSTDILSRSDRSEARRRINAPNFFNTLPMLEGAEQAHELRELADVWVVSKPLEANPTCRDDKAQWLREHFGDWWASRLILTPDKSMVRGDLLLDDAPKLAWLPAATWQPVVYPWPWNGEGSTWEGLPRWQWGQPTKDLLAIDNAAAARAAALETFLEEWESELAAKTNLPGLPDA